MSRSSSLLIRCVLLLGASLPIVAGCGDSQENIPVPDLNLLRADMTMPPPGPDLSTPPDLVPPPDLAIPPCANTAKSCGLPGMCADCTMSPTGSACVMVAGAQACGCNSEKDCPVGTACDPEKHVCGAACAGPADDGGVTVLPCNGGCCDGTSCVTGNANGACGADGGRCAVCGAGTPTCSNGACTPTCAPGGMGGASCGKGFCCGAGNTCVGLANASCGAAGAACVDCAKSSDGPLCDVNSGACGCSKSADCPMGQACKGGVCTTACDGNAACNGGCCDVPQGQMAGTCAPGNAAAACAVAAACVSCAGNAKGAACVVVNNATSCGCNSAADCPAGQACNANTKSCSATCDAMTPCNGGCCAIAQGQMTGMCVAGTAQASCGNNGGVCVNCQSQFQGMMAGSACVATMGGGTCGCNANPDCPANSAGCNVQTKLCNFTCSAMAPCLTGCCAIPMGMNTGSCVAGGANAACGGTGVCADCTNAAAGRICYPATKKCGCNVAGDCPANTACNTTTHVCENVCGDANHTGCNTGCCSAGKCVAGAANNACGAAGACADCTNNNAGKVCIGGKACGCNAAADCPAGTACNTKTNVCETTCGDANHTVCNTGCCNLPQGQMMGVCVAGTQNASCGNDGKVCTACGKGTPTCTAGACTSTCGNVGNGTCDGGFCCSANKCVAGNAQASCGFSGACADCTNANVGRKCVATAMAGPWFCGCDVAGDCPAANANAGTGGLACDLTAHNCTTTCGIQGITTVCNGGCCQFTNGAGVCRPGAAPTTCGNSGGLCTNCALNCANVATCSGGACGCCLGSNAVCQMNAQCCAGNCANGRCACIATGSPCVGGAAALCCAGRFGQTQICGGVNSVCCLATNAFCQQNADCCNGTCQGNGRCN